MKLILEAPNTSNCKFIENTMYGSRPANIYQTNKGNYRIDLYTKGKYMCSQYYKQIPQYITGRSI